MAFGAGIWGDFMNVWGDFMNVCVPGVTYECVCVCVWGDFMNVSVFLCACMWMLVICWCAYVLFVSLHVCVVSRAQMRLHVCID